MTLAAPTGCSTGMPILFEHIHITQNSSDNDQCSALMQGANVRARTVWSSPHEESGRKHVKSLPSRFSSQACLIEYARQFKTTTHDHINTPTHHTTHGFYWRRSYSDHTKRHTQTSCPHFLLLPSLIALRFCHFPFMTCHVTSCVEPWPRQRS